LSLGLIVGAGILTLTYMMRTWQQVFQQKFDETRTDIKIKAPGQGDSYFAPLVLIGVNLALGVFAGPLIYAAQLTVEQLGNPSVYITAVRLYGG
jgi:formate hydrogenlyase subunit 3/multisubunit Na+/H+ antiporter MnhD subunit